MKDRELLQAVRDRITEREDWCQKSYFRDRMGRPIWDEAEFSNAISWTLGGAAQAVLGYKSGATLRLAKLLGFPSPYPVNRMNDWNDTQTHVNVLKRLDEAIEALS